MLTGTPKIQQGINLIIATGQNALAMNRTVKQIAEPPFGDSLAEGLIVVDIETLADGDPDNNFLKRAATFNPMVLERALVTRPPLWEWCAASDECARHRVLAPLPCRRNPIYFSARRG